MGLAPAVQIHYSYPDAEEMFVDVERELGLGEQEPFNSPTGLCRPPTGFIRILLSGFSIIC